MPIFVIRKQKILKESVFEQYKNKKYWNKYVRYYFFQYCKKRLKIQIEKFLGK